MEDSDLAGEDADYAARATRRRRVIGAFLLAMFIGFPAVVFYLVWQIF